MDNEELDQIVNDEIGKEEKKEANKIVPAYAKKEDKEDLNKSKGKNKKNKKEKNVKPKNRKSIISKILIGIIFVAVIVGIVFLVRFLTKPDYEKYRPYEEKMSIYGYDTMYDNQSALTEEKVTKSEAIKMITSTMLNTTDILKMARKSEKEFSNADYVDYAIGAGIISEDEINEKNADDAVKYEEVIKYIEAAKKIILKKEVSTDTEVKAKNYKSMPADVQIAISDLVSNDIIDNEAKKINLNQKVFKGMLNQMLINIAEKFNTITIGDSKLNINPDKVPSNADQYTYILSNVDKKVYEYDFIKEDEYAFLNPRATYLKKRDVYSSIQYVVEDYYNLILNVDYETINADDFYSKLDYYLINKVSQEDVNKYVNYVKENRIKLKGSAKTQMPAVYFDGEKYRVRTKIEFEVLNSNTQLNLLIFDAYSGNNFQYKNYKYELIVDTKMLTAFSFETLYIYNSEFVSSIISDKSGIE